MIRWYLFCCHGSLMLSVCNVQRRENNYSPLPVLHTCIYAQSSANTSWKLCETGVFSLLPAVNLRIMHTFKLALDIFVFKIYTKKCHSVSSACYLIGTHILCMVRDEVEIYLHSCILNHCHWNITSHKFIQRYCPQHSCFWTEYFCSESRLLNLILLNLIVRWPSECSHYINN